MHRKSKLKRGVERVMFIAWSQRAVERVAELNRGAKSPANQAGYQHSRYTPEGYP